MPTDLPDITAAWEAYAAWADETEREGFTEPPNARHLRTALDAAHTDAFFAGAEAMRVAVEARSPAGPTLAPLLVDRIDESELLTAYLATKEPA